MKQLCMIDGIGPFFNGYQRRRYNWSKIPFENLEKDGRVDLAKFRAVREDFSRFIGRAAEMGFNAVTLDDVAHLAWHPYYSDAVLDKIRGYREQYLRLFQIARNHGMKVYLTTDVMYYYHTVQDRGWDLETRIIPFFRYALYDLFSVFEDVAGVIFRFGECDSLDNKGDFQSELAVRTPHEANRFISELLPVFERDNRDMIVRTWTVGAYRIGDLIWNRKTFDTAFDGIKSPNFMISMKYGETDFFRYLPLNKLFYRSDHRKIIELQARREYEGFGEYPSFVGWDYDHYRHQLKDVENVVGSCVWCQTGGWSGFNNRTFIEGSSLWNELNTFVTARSFHADMSPEESVKEFCDRYLPEVAPERLLHLLRLSDEVIKELLYLDELATRKLFFRRVRVPPLLSVFWDTVIVTHSMRKLMRCLAADGEEKVRQGYDALKKIREMQQIALEEGLPTEGFDFQYDTFEILAVAREYYFGPFSQGVVERLEELCKVYRKKYEKPYSVSLDFSPFRMSRARMRRFLAVFLRHKRGYRLIDRLVLLRLLGWLAPLFRRRQPRMVPDFAREQAMGIDAILR